MTMAAFEPIPGETPIDHSGCPCNGDLFYALYLPPRSDNLPSMDYLLLPSLFDETFY
jgi:hypothetical protein